MKRKLLHESCLTKLSENEIIKKRRVYKAKRNRDEYIANIGGASDDDEEVSRPLKKMINSFRDEIITKRLFQKIDRSNVPSYIN